MNNWSVIRTRSRWEKKVATRLQQKGIETFCPLLKCRHQWSDRMKTIEKPLLKSYVFAKVTEDQRTIVRLTEGVVNFEYRNGKPIVIKEKLVQSIREFQQAYPDVEVSEAAMVPVNGNDHSSKPAEKNGVPSLSIEMLNLVLIARPAHPVLVEATINKI